MIGDLTYSALEQIIRQVDLSEPRLKEAPWTEEESRFVEDNWQYMTNDEIGAAIGRSGGAVNLRSKRMLRLPARSKNPDFITSCQMAMELGIDLHKTWAWVDHGMIKRADIPQAPTIRIVRRVDFLRWAINPRNWIYFDINGVKDPVLKRYLKWRSARWGDEWWTTRRAADYWGVDDKDIQRYIKTGRLPGVQPKFSIGGRHHDRSWSYWFVLRSDVMATRVWSRTNGMKFMLDMEFPPSADEFLIRAVEELGCNSKIIGRMMKKKSNSIIRRYHQLTGKNLPYWNWKHNQLKQETK